MIEKTVICKKTLKDGTVISWETTKMVYTPEEVKAREKARREGWVDEWYTQHKWNDARWMPTCNMKEIKEAYEEFKDIMNDML